MQPTDRSFDSFAAEYDFMATLTNQKQNKQQFLLENLSNFRGKALDIGCGSGILSWELAQHYDTVIGIDISAEMLAIAQAKRSAPNLNYIQMDATQITLNSKFDFIVSANTFHHLPNLPTTLKQIKQLLKPQGKIAIIDNVSETETPATIGYIIGAIRDFLPDCSDYGIINAWKLYKFRTSKKWLNHLASDRYLSPKQFKHIYSAIFPNCSFPKTSYFMGVTWESPK
ncbi:MAG: class I SAM-dependent methyltransferase [Kamptonema sp. SIO1D9]|nr:class I SAM-dependent methyltransferase [Kamptonema sp. SIO1D9]